MTQGLANNEAPQPRCLAPFGPPARRKLAGGGTIGHRELAGSLGSLVLGPVAGSSKLDEADPPTPPELESAG